LRFEKRIGIGAAGLILGLAVLAFFLGYLLPASTHVERKTFIETPPEVLYGLMNDLGQLKHWAPWQARDPDVEYQIDEPGRGLNARLQWQSDDSTIDSGELTIIDAQPYSRLRMLLERGGHDRAVLDFQLELLENGTHIVWTLDIEHGSNPFARYHGLLVARRYEALLEPGLDQLRRLAELQPVPAAQNIVTEEITYKVDNKPFTGFVAYDRSRQYRPGVLIVHEWWGHNDYVRKRAEQLAGLGYVAMALDMYGGGKHVHHPDEAGKLAGEVKARVDLAQQRFTAALNVLKDHPAVNRQQLAAIGYCFGGNIVLNMARAGLDLDGVVSFHGSLEAIEGEARQGVVKASILVLNGADDPLVPQQQREAFMEEMSAAGVDFEFINYPGAKHAFTNPDADKFAEQFGLPLAYDAGADQQSWQKMRDFFDRIFR
jgi:dienelactone hydrolase